MLFFFLSELRTGVGDFFSKANKGPRGMSLIANNAQCHVGSVPKKWFSSKVKIMVVILIS